MKNLALLAILSAGLFSIGMMSFVEAHPHSTLELMGNHSHDLYSSEDFLIHTFEQVVLFIGQIQSLIFG
ncbi:hypothetical protein AAA799D07_00066 [Marine Group I thaumarchaeote SCGC AAA799-D07]|jgi:CII-binding regulator of phage lambda lysogenization HflD|nr:hypothetical protein AAA799D07_00066 [Marine Group I thaumarchaeote SCGC AAA799-D07]